MNKILFVLFSIFSIPSFAQSFSTNVITGAEQLNDYLPQLKNKKVALLVNQTSVIHHTHLVDTLLSSGINIVKIFAPEHGFRGTGDAGEKIKSGIDTKTGLNITSMYGASKKPSKESMQGIDVVVFDIQDVGARFYTYISSLQYMMEACAENNIPLMILDRPNPNGFYVDGPVLEPSFRSFVGMQSVPIVHGMTVGEYARMLNGEISLAKNGQCDLVIISCKNYSHKTLYTIPIPPSPNLKSMTAILHYPSLCLFEGTVVSVGRGTTTPFEVWGHPDFKNKFDFSFTPVSMPGAKTPPHQNEICYGMRFNESKHSNRDIETKLNLSYLLKAYSLTVNKDSFFTSFFDKLAGTDKLRKQIIEGKSEEEIRMSWQEGLILFKKIRKNYLLYEDFE